jgi:Outer membrane protein beta-barrel domain
MMESNFYSDEFEQLIREKTEQYKMYPSEKVWKGVYSSLHTKKRWFIAGMSVLVTGIIFVAGKELIAPSGHAAAAKKPALTAALSNTKTTPENTVLPVAFSEYKPGSRAAIGHNGDGSGSFQDDQPTPDDSREVGIVDPGTGLESETANTVNQLIDIAAGFASPATVSSERTDAPITGAGIRQEIRDDVSATGATENRQAETYTKYLTRLRLGNGLSSFDPDYARVNINMYSGLFPGTNPAPGLQIPLHPSATNRSIARMYNFDPMESSSSEEPDTITAVEIGEQKVNWLQEYAVNNIHHTPQKSGDFWQLYIAPTATFRSLSGGSYQNPKSATTPLPVALANVQDFTDHTLAVGFEVGADLLHRVSHNLAFKIGLQFNYSRFTMTNTAANPGGSGGAPQGRDSATAASPAAMSSFGGKLQETLHNEYYQLSVPVGLELKVVGNDRLQLKIAASVQPTYLLNTNSYLLTPDFSNYTKQPSAFRKWNLDGGVEIYVSYKINKNISLLAGPEFRYQLLSSYTSQYPIRENLQQYGLKIGFTKALH